MSDGLIKSAIWMASTAAECGSLMCQTESSLITIRLGISGPLGTLNTQKGDQKKTVPWTDEAQVSRTPIGVPDKGTSNSLTDRSKKRSRKNHEDSDSRTFTLDRKFKHMLGLIGGVRGDKLGLNPPANGSKQDPKESLVVIFAASSESLYRDLPPVTNRKRYAT